jgi:hypothetical protein
MKRLILSAIIILMLVSICLAPIYKNTASQKVFVFAYDKTTGLGKIDDEPNITARITTGGVGTVTNDAHPTPVDDTNCPGIYAFDLTQGETNYNQFVLYAKSTTSNILINPVTIVTQASIDQTGDSYPTVLAIAADVNRSNYIWYVAKNGNNSNDGHSEQTAKLTINATITASANGDTIYIYPGTYAENVILTKSLNLWGTSRYSCIIAPTSGSAVTGGSPTDIRNLTITGGNVGFTNGIAAVTGIVDNCTIYGHDDGIYIPGNFLVISNSIIGSSYDGIQISSGSNILIDNCFIWTDGSSDSITTGARALTTGGCKNLIVRNTICYATMALNGDDYSLVACNIEGQAILDNVSLYSYHTGTGLHQTIGLKIGTNGNLTANNLSINAQSASGVSSHGSGYVYDIYVTGNNTSNSMIDNFVVVPATVESRADALCTVSAQGTGNKKLTFICSGLGSAPNDFFNEYYITWLSGSNAGQSMYISDWGTSNNEFILASACTDDIQVDDTFSYVSLIRKDIKQTGGTLKVDGGNYDANYVEGTVTDLALATNTSVAALPTATEVNECVAAKITAAKQAMDINFIVTDGKIDDVNIIGGGGTPGGQ